MPDTNAKIEKIIERMSRIKALAIHPNYNKSFSLFVTMLRHSRLPWLKTNPIFVKAFQATLAKTLAKFQGELRALKGKQSKAASEDEVKNTDHRIIMYEEWIRVLQTIADGVAWRNLRFNRPILRVFSEHASTGHLSEEDLKTTYKFLMSMPHTVLVNDLTRCLRIADFTQVRPNGKVMLYEMKQSGDLVKNVGWIIDQMKRHKRPPSKQELPHLVAQFAVIDKKITVPVYNEGLVRDVTVAHIVDTNFRVKTHHRRIRRLIRRADREFVTAEEVEPGYHVEVTAFDKIRSKADLEKMKAASDQARKGRPTWGNQGNTKDVIAMTSYISLAQEEGEYARLILPYSVLPLPAKDCVRLMMGRVEIKVLFHLPTLADRLRQEGWRIADARGTEMKGPDQFFRKPVDESLFAAEKSMGDLTFKTTVPSTAILQAISSFYQIRFLTDGMSALMARERPASSGRQTSAQNFVGERKVLI